MLIMDAILLGGGVGHRFSEIPSTIPKQFQLLGEVPVFIHAIRSLHSLRLFRQIVVTAPASYFHQTKAMIQKYLSSDSQSNIRVVVGGARRQDSSSLALDSLAELDPMPHRVAIHDACRPFLSKEFLNRIEKSLKDESFAAWIPVIPVTETLKRIEGGRVAETVDRESIQRVQTPQIFDYETIQTLMARAKKTPALHFTDDASLCEHYGISVGIFEGDVNNIKLTYPFELEALSSIMGKIFELKKEKRATCELESDMTFTV